MNRWFVVDTDGIQYGGPHTCEQDALMAMIEMVHDLPPHVESPYLIECGSAGGPWPYAVPAQRPSH